MWLGSLLRQVRPYLAHRPDCPGQIPPAACTCGAAHYQEQVRRTLRDYAPETFPVVPPLERNAGA
jgi:hypothetical protein